MSDNLKLRRDQTSGNAARERLTPHTDATEESARIDNEESQMRKALGLTGDAPRHRPEPDRTEPQHRMAERFGGSGAHRRRFVQDGDVPVTVLRRDQGHEAQPQRVTNPAASPTTNRLQRVEAALAAETTAREKAERALADAHAVVRDLQTKIGHAELARAEAQEALLHEREAMAHFRQDTGSWEDRLQDAISRLHDAEHAMHASQEQVAEEQRARHAAEKALELAEAARDHAEHIRDLSDTTAETSEWLPPMPVRRLSEHAAISPAIRRRRAAEPSIVDQEPIKWWLTLKPAPRKR